MVSFQTVWAGTATAGECCYKIITVYDEESIFVQSTSIQLAACWRNIASYATSPSCPPPRFPNHQHVVHHEHCKVLGSYNTCVHPKALQPAGKSGISHRSLLVSLVQCGTSPSLCRWDASTLSLSNSAMSTYSPFCILATNLAGTGGRASLRKNGSAWGSPFQCCPCSLGSLTTGLVPGPKARPRLLLDHFLPRHWRSPCQPLRHLPPPLSSSVPALQLLWRGQRPQGSFYVG